MKVLKGKAWLFGDNLDVDQELVPYRKVKSLPGYPAVSDEELGKLCMTYIDPDFPKKMKKGDILVGGTNVGCGHDHATGPRAIKGCGISVVIAQSLHEWFLRNCILLGLPAVQHPQVKENVKQGDELEVDLVSGRLTNLTTGDNLRFEPLPKFLLDIIDSGNLYTYVKEKVKSGKLNTYLE